jgi:hypothetical protein
VKNAIFRIVDRAARGPFPGKEHLDGTVGRQGFALAIRNRRTVLGEELELDGYRRTGIEELLQQITKVLELDEKVSYEHKGIVQTIAPRDERVPVEGDELQGTFPVSVTSPVQPATGLTK